MSERPEWMPSSSEIGLASSFDEERWIDYPKTKDLIRRTGLRAQVAALEELIAHMRARYTSEANPTGSYCNEESLWIAEKIEEIRREIG